MLLRIADFILDEVTKTDFPNAHAWCAPLRRYRRELLEEVTYLEDLKASR
jgi:hypothetical protein